MNKFKKIGIATFGFGVLFTALMGFAHTSAGRPLLAIMGRLVGKVAPCPLGYDQHATLEEKEMLRKSLAEAHRGIVTAESRVVLDFELGKSSRTDIENWVRDHQGICRELSDKFNAECTGKFYQSEDTTLWLEFDDREILVSLRGIQKFRSAEVALELFIKLRDRLKKQAGPSALEQGEAKTEFLNSGLLSQASISADFKNFAGTARISNLGEAFALTHDFRSF